MATPLLQFVQRVFHQHGIGLTQRGAGHAIGLIEAWLTANDLPLIDGSAYQLLDRADLTVYRIVRRTMHYKASPGSVIVWDASPTMGNGHCAVALASTLRSVCVLEQDNPQGSYCRIRTANYTGILGWILLPEYVPW